MSKIANLRFEDITKVFIDEKKGEFTAVKGSTFEVKDKEFVVFVGPSGCGKTTSLRMIAGLEKQTSGDIYIDDVLVNKLHPKDRDIAMVFQDYALYPHMTVRQNLEFGLKNMKVDPEEIKKKVDYSAKVLQLDAFLERKPKELSGGQRQRVALGRSIVRSPKIFLFDEPLSNLDAKLRVQMRMELSRLHKELEATMVYVTHDQVEAMTLGDRIVIMDHAIVQQIADPETLYKEPANTFVAGFIGSPPMNLIKATLKNSSEVEVDGHVLTIPAEKRETYKDYVGKEVIFGIRPEHITLQDEMLDNTIEKEVVFSEFLGAESLVFFTLNGENITVKHFDDKIVHSEVTHKFAFDMDKMHLFDADTELAIR